MKTKYIKEIEHKIKSIRVEHIMSKFAITTTPETSITDLAHLLMRFKISGVPVVDSNNRIIGIVTATDLFRVMKEIIEKINNNNISDTEKLQNVKSIMTPIVNTISKDITLFDTLKLMHEHNIHTLPVVEGSEIIGIIGRRDVINSFFTDKD